MCVCVWQQEFVPEKSQGSGNNSCKNSKYILPGFPHSEHKIKSSGWLFSFFSESKPHIRHLSSAGATSYNKQNKRVITEMELDLKVSPLPEPQLSPLNPVL